MKKWLKMAVCLVIAGCAAGTEVSRPVAAAKQEAVLIHDALVDKAAPDNFRSVENIRVRLKEDGDTAVIAGLDELRASGSAEFSEVELAWLKRRLGEGLIIVDLRQESHGFLNGNPVTWYTRNNWINLGKTREQALQDESRRLAALSGSKTACVYSARSAGEPGNQVEIEQVYSEEQLAGRHNLRYFRLTVPDHRRPADEDVDRFVAFVRTLSDKDWLHFHCLAGMGRTTTFLAMYDMLRNAGEASLEDIAARQAAVPPYYDLFNFKPKLSGEKDYRDRADFLRLFYEYAKAFRSGDKVSWTEWLNKKTINTDRN